MMRRTLACVTALLAIVLAGVAAVAARQAPDDGIRYVNGNHLVLPADYREWVWVSSGLGMTYEGEAARPGAPPTFTNVFVNPVSYRAFMATGRWPDRTLFILEFRASTSQGSINTGGHFQGPLVGVEAEVKDARFPDGWAFYNFGPAAERRTTTAPVADPARCVECHTKHTAVERTFVQFYPTLLDAARKHGTVKPGF
jgi:hypothetical protein